MKNPIETVISRLKAKLISNAGVIELAGIYSISKEKAIDLLLPRIKVTRVKDTLKASIEFMDTTNYVLVKDSESIKVNHILVD